MVAFLKSLTAAQTIRIPIQTHDAGRWPMELERAPLNGGTNRKQVHTT